MIRPRVPVELARLPLRTVRPQQARGVYAAPGPQVARLEAGGALRRLARGYYVVVPDTAGSTWHPTIEQAALGIAVSIFGPGGAALMAQSAARIHHALPRAVGNATVAAERQHRPIVLVGGGRVEFVRRDLDALVLRREQMGDLGAGLVTSPEQTLVDLAGRHSSRLEADERPAVLRALVSISDAHQVDKLASVSARAAISQMVATS